MTLWRTSELLLEDGDTASSGMLHDLTVKFRRRQVLLYVVLQVMVMLHVRLSTHHWLHQICTDTVHGLPEDLAF